eukprot:1697902-Ditylum_brightwellii.AAC.1
MAIQKKKSKMVYYQCPSIFKQYTCLLVFQETNCVETSTYGSEIVAGCIAIDLAVKMGYNLRMLGAPVKGTTVLFGDNKSMITNTSLPHSNLKTR